MKNARRPIISDRWTVAKSDEDLTERLARELAVTPLLAQLLVNRDIASPEEARGFLKPALSDLAEPGQLPGIPEAAGRIADAVRNGEAIVVYGDYDADGTAAVALLMRGLRLVGADVSYYVPHRLDEGYGLNMAAMSKLVEEGASLVVSVDCGVTAFEEAEFLAANGVDLVITDHHEPMGRLPRAVAIADPKVDCAGGDRNASGVGVAFKLAWGVAQEFSPGKKVTDDFREFLREALALVALGTVADVVPLLGENRAMVDYGLRLLKESRLPGINALVNCAQLPTGPVLPRHVAFQLAPLLNAAGRMGDAKTAIELFITDETSDAYRLAGELEQHNKLRREIGECMLAEAMDAVEEFSDDPVLVIANPDWHSGIIGIVAGKLAETFYRPAIVIATDNGIGQGSARSVPEVNIFEILKMSEELLESFGGHSQAAGLRIRVERIGELRERLCENVLRMLDGRNPEKILRADAEVSLDRLTRDALEELDRLAPFGAGNPKPVMVAGDVEIVGEPKTMGSSGQHVCFYARQGGTSLRVVGFRFPKDFMDRLKRGVMCNIAFEPRSNEWNGMTNVELILKDIAFEGE